MEQIKADWRKLDLSPAERAMLEFCEKLTLTPSSMTRQDTDRLREEGWTDREWKFRITSRYACNKSNGFG